MSWTAWGSGEADQPAWNETLAQRLIGRSLLVGLTHIGGDREWLEQFHGTVQSSHPKAGIVLQLAGARSGEAVTLPPDLRSVSPADPGSYRLRESGELVENPDYLATWDVTHPAD